MLKFPSRLGVIERRRIPGKLKLIHHRVCATLFSFEQKRHVNLEFDELRCLIFIASRGAFVQRLETVPRFRIFLLLKGNLRQIILSLAKFRIQLGCLLKCRFRLVELLLLHQNLAA